ncbi:DUF7575 domain-containing protein [Blautia sp.]
MARDFFDELSDTITRTTKDLGKKAGQLYETQKIRSKISSEEQIVQKLKADIGNVIFEKYKEGAELDEALKGFCEEIQQHLDIIAGYRDSAAELKGQKICPACGRHVDRSVSFCPFCGSVCPTPQPETETAEGDVIDSETEETAAKETAAEAENEAEEAEETAAEAENEAEKAEETAAEAENEAEEAEATVEAENETEETTE